jgi:cytochrome c biogenesis protein CcmG/thiol:disulfide interchange protein DsbE
VDRLKLFIPLVLFIALSVLLYMGLKKNPDELPSALIGKSVPIFSLPSLTDETKSIDQNTYLGRPYLLNVWATWCPSCKDEHPYLVELSKMGIPIVGLNYKDEQEDAKKLLLAMGNPYIDNIVDKEGRLGLNLGVYGAPETFVVDAKGVIRFKVVGVVTPAIWANDIAPIMFGE